MDFIVIDLRIASLVWISATKVGFGIKLERQMDFGIEFQSKIYFGKNSMKFKQINFLRYTLRKPVADCIDHV